MTELKINNLLEEKNLTAEECAEKAGIAFSIFNQIRTGRISPTLENIESIALALDVHPSEIVPSFGNTAIESDENENKQPEQKKDSIFLCPDCGCRINSQTGKKI